MNELRESLDRALGGLRFGEDMKKAVKEKTLSKGRRSPGLPRRALVALAVCGALIVTALAAGPTLWDWIRRDMGSFAPYSQPVEGVSVSDQGIEVRAVAALADENGGTVYLEVADRTSDRLDGKTAWNAPYAENICLTYDAETHTALFARPLWPEERKADGTATVSIARFLPGSEIFEGVRVPWEGHTAVLDSYVLSREEDGQTIENKRVLRPNQTPMDLEDTDLFTVSSMGYDSDGSYHIQLALAWGVEATWGAIYPMWGEIAGGAYDDHCFLLEGGAYVDWVWQDLRGAELEEVLPDTWSGRLTTRPAVQGAWTLTVPLTAVEPRVVASEEVLYGMRLEELIFSAMSLRIRVAYEDPDQPGQISWPVTLLLRDGSTVPLGRFKRWDTLYWTEEGEVRTSNQGGQARYGNFAVWAYPRAIEPGEIVGVGIGYWMLPIGGDDTAEGAYWMEAPLG